VASKREARAAAKAARKARKKEKAKALVATSLPTEKPKAFLTAEGQSAHPIFCFRFAEHRSEAPACFKPTPEQATEIFEFLCEMGRLSWGEIENQTTGGRSRHKKHHEQPIESLTSDKAKEAIGRRSLDETFGDSIFRFRMEGEKRLWGFRNDSTFHVVFWDPDHRLYETSKG
jgi:hypothetical protein